MIRYVAFLRGINVGGRNIVKMENLRKIFQSLEFDDVRTYIQSGNVLFSTEETRSGTIVQKIENTLLTQLGFEVKTIIRTAAHLENLLKQKPFGKEKPSEKLKLYVTFTGEELSVMPSLPLISSNRDLEVFRIVGRDLFTLSREFKGRFGFPNNFIEDQLRIKATTRNWETIRKMPAITNLSTG